MYVYLRYYSEGSVRDKLDKNETINRELDGNSSSPNKIAQG